MVIACTIYAFTTETDFTTSWGFIVVLSAAMLVLAIMSIFSNSLFIHNLYCALGVILFGFYLIIDTQMIMGGKNAELTVDDYVVASFCLYVDIIQIFLYILDLLRSNNND
jgi:FtsH-binding integral membrane protein